MACSMHKAWPRFQVRMQEIESLACWHLLQGTLALELLQQADAGLDGMIVCVSGGGMISGVATAAKGLQPGITILAAEPSGGTA